MIKIAAGDKFMLGNTEFLYEGLHPERKTHIIRLISEAEKAAPPLFKRRSKIKETQN